MTPHDALRFHLPLHGASLADLALVVVVLLGFVMLGTSRMAACVRAAAAQGAVLGLVPALLELDALRARTVALAAGAFVIKAVLIPRMLLRALREVRVRREVEPFIGYTASLGIGALATGAAFLFSAGLPLPPAHQHGLVVPAALSTAFMGALVIVSRKKAITQVVGYLGLENGIFLLGLILHRAMPGVVEVGVLLDVLVAVFTMGIVIFHISREFASVDTTRLSALRED